MGQRRSPSVRTGL